MAESKTSTPTPAEAAEQGKTVVVVGVDDSERSYHALEWTVRHVAAGAAELVVVHAKPSAASVIGFGGTGGFGGKNPPFFSSLDRDTLTNYCRRHRGGDDFQEPGRR
jgi:hypothetical protein